MSLCHCTTGMTPGLNSSSPVVTVTSPRPISGPAAPRSTLPPAATASSCAPRQIPIVGTPSSTALASSSRTDGSHGATSSSYAPIGPPSTISASPSTDGRHPVAEVGVGRMHVDADRRQPLGELAETFGRGVLDDMYASHEIPTPTRPGGSA